MQLYLVRHGAALANAIDGDRSLSELGQQQVAQLADYFAQHCPQPLDIFHSGILRACQTAEAIAQQRQVHTLQAISGLMPQDDPSPMLLNIAAWQRDTVLVGHLPYMQILLIDLVGASGLNIEFSPATAVCVAQIDQHWQIQWQFSPSRLG